MKSRYTVSILFLILAVVACNLPATAPSAATAIPPVPANPTIPVFFTDTPLPSPTPLPSETPLPTATSTPTVPITWPKDVAVNCRFGPGVEWEIISALKVDVVAEIAGRNASNTWWYIKDPLNPGFFCWVAMSVTIAAGNLATVPIINDPSALVVDISVDANVSFVACGGPNPISFSGSITTNGPTTVTYQWEVGGDKENTTPPDTITFDEAGTKDVPDPGVFTADCGNYFIRLHVTDPNDKAAKKNFKIEP